MAEYRNKAYDSQDLVSVLCPILRSVRHRRQYIENEWLLSYRSWQGWPSFNYMVPLPDGAIHYFVPHARRAIERNVIRKTKLSLPQRSWFTILPRDLQSHREAEAVTSLLDYIYHWKYRTKRIISSNTRALELYDFCVLSTSPFIEHDEVWPTQRDVDPFSFYIFPDTASSLQQATLLFEDVIVPFQLYDSFVNHEDPSKSFYMPLHPSDLHKPEWPYHLIERLSYRGLSSPSDFSLEAGKGHSLREEDFRDRHNSTESSLRSQAHTFVSLTKCYFRYRGQWLYAVICNNMKGSGLDSSTASESPYNAKLIRLDDDKVTPHYHWTNTRVLPGEGYTNSHMDDIRVLQHLANNALSQVESNRARFAEPPVMVDVEASGRMQARTFANRQIWDVVGDPNKLMKSLDIEDTSTNGIRALQIYLGLMDKESGGTIAEGSPGRNMPRAGFAMNNLLNLSLAEIESDADTMDQDINSLGLSDTFQCIQEYTPHSQVFRLPGMNKGLPSAVRMSQLYGDYAFQWEGSPGIEDAEQRANKLMQFFQLILNPQILPVLLQQLAQTGETLDIAAGIKMMYAYGLSERGIGTIVRDLTPQEQQALQAQQQQPNPEMLQAQQEQQQSAQEHQQSMQAEQQKAQLQAAQGQQELQQGAQEHAQNLQAQQAKNSLDQQAQRVKMLMSFDRNGSTKESSHAKG